MNEQQTWAPHSSWIWIIISRVWMYHAITCTYLVRAYSRCACWFWPQIFGIRWKRRKKTDDKQGKQNPELRTDQTILNHLNRRSTRKLKYETEKELKSRKQKQKQTRMKCKMNNRVNDLSQSVDPFFFIVFFLLCFFAIRILNNTFIWCSCSIRIKYIWMNSYRA